MDADGFLKIISQDARIIFALIAAGSTLLALLGLLVRYLLKTATGWRDEASDFRNKLQECEDRHIKGDAERSELQSRVYILESMVGKLQSAWTRLADGLGHAFIRADENGNITYWDDQAKRIFGWDATAITGKPIWWLVPMLDRAQMKAAYLRAAAEKKNFDRAVLGTAVCAKGEPFQITLKISGRPDNGSWFSQAEAWEVVDAPPQLDDSLLAPVKQNSKKT